MKKTITILALILISVQLLNAQTNPALLTNLKVDGNAGTGRKISWDIANNEVVSRFDVQKSINGTEFTTIGVLFATHKRGSETYTYSGQEPEGPKVMYRIKMLSKGQDTYYSSIVIVSIPPKSYEKISVLGNPAKDKLVFRFNERQTQPLEINIYDLAGRIISNIKISSAERNNIVSIPLNTSMSIGIHIAEVYNGVEKWTFKFVKQ